MYIYGASGHAKIVIDILYSQSIDINGLIDDDENINKLNGLPVFRKEKALNIGDEPLIIAIGNNEIRRKIVSELPKDIIYGKAIAKSSDISQSAFIGEGSVIIHGSIIQTETDIGKHCIINTGSSIDHECHIEDYVHISPHSTLCGNVYVGEGTQIGAGSVIIPGIKIGKNTIVGAGSVVVSNIPDNVIAFGNPCRVFRYL